MDLHTNCCLHKIGLRVFRNKDSKTLRWLVANNSNWKELAEIEFTVILCGLLLCME